jgi:hypothetical protein
MNELVIVKVLVDAHFYEKCLSAYNQLEAQKTHKSHAEKNSESSEKNSESLLGGGLITEEPPTTIPNSEPSTKLIRSPSPPPSTSNDVVLEKIPPLLVPKTSKDEHQVVLHMKMPKTPSKNTKRIVPRKKSSEKKSVQPKSQPVFKHTPGMPWYFIGLED